MAMIESGVSLLPQALTESALSDDLAQGDVVLGTIGPVLGHLLANQDQSLFSDEVVARVRGMVSHVAMQLLLAQAEEAGEAEPYAFAQGRRDALAAELAGFQPLLTHCHALALEWQLAMRLEARNVIDPVLSPLLQALIASDDGSTASAAMAALTAQARFIQQQRRMELPVHELPGDLFHNALLIWANCSVDDAAPAVAKAQATARATFDESASRAGLLARSVAMMGKGAMAAMSLDHAGLAIFLTTLASASGQDRDIVAISTNDRQMTRLALAMRAAGVSPRDLEKQFLFIHPDAALPAGVEALSAERAAILLAASRRNTAG
ncbi:hypothetical protein GRI44_05525 [Altererythrobacter confluentis]|uniref:Uncharacterized protein n=1 Tax=Allopontixanthobacter confluentis TaxID=1849021 RepID=A0A6L7GE48_9SPHN|nr:hypothetical protein [Allopontixanthobacter confluentis]MXP14207.1 hypothetical protein [Allopontixanthobacter confluentis]